MKTTSTLKRALHPMPKDIREALHDAELMDAYKARPPYQRNDYIGWITRAKQEATREKRLNQMVAELKRGDRYMKMIWNSRN